jgi:uncharacterized protein YneF (UPF0154 family)
VLEIKMVDDVTPIKPEVKAAAKSIPSQISNEERGPLNECYMEMMALRNGMAALEAQVRQYTAQIEIARAQAQAMQIQGVELEKQFNALWLECRTKNGIPDKWELNTKTGAVNPPAPVQPQR